ncbi:hypothetical protein C8J56DRAFT_1126896 [Mycena floridula]|nr:hypothetical protein C8J56DRAFT_1126896 [Mycena floridula]
MLQFEDLSAWIQIDGSETKEYGVQVNENGKTPTVTCWIVSEAGKQFTINFKSLGALCGGYPSIDGNEVCGTLAGPADLYKVGTIQGYYTDTQTIRPFLFSDIDLTDEDTFLHQKLHPEFGDITLSIYRVQITGRGRVPVPENIQEPGKLHERSKKGMIHQIGAAPAIPYNHIFTEVRQLGPPVVKFVFKYRTMAQLMANEIVPRPKRPAEASIELSDDSDDEEAKEEAALRARLAEIDAKKARKRVKREHVKNEDVKPVLFRGETIDLT